MQYLNWTASNMKDLTIPRIHLRTNDSGIKASVEGHQASPIIMQGMYSNSLPHTYSAYMIRSKTMKWMIFWDFQHATHTNLVDGEHQGHQTTACNTVWFSHDFLMWPGPAICSFWCTGYLLAEYSDTWSMSFCGMWMHWSFLRPVKLNYLAWLWPAINCPLQDQFFGPLIAAWCTNLIPRLWEDRRLQRGCKNDLRVIVNTLGSAIDRYL